MTRKFYDMIACDSGYVNYVVDTEEKDDKVIIECECGAHMLQVGMDATIYTNKDGSKQCRQSYYLAMFNYGSDKGRNIWQRIVIAFKYLRTGKMFSDQLTLTPEEAKKFSFFVDKTIIPTEALNHPNQ